MKIVIYTTPTCAYCRMAKQFLTQRGVGFTEKDVSRDSNAANEMVGRSGQMSVPVIIIDDEVVVGFDRPRLEELLAKSGTQKPPSFGLRVADAARVTRKTGAPVSGAYVGKVGPGSIGERAGLREGDIITEINTQPVRNAGDLERVFAGLSWGNLLTVLFLRGGETRKSEFTL